VNGREAIAENIPRHNQKDCTRPVKNVNYYDTKLNAGSAEEYRVGRKYDGAHPASSTDPSMI
jgi:hypothetical protein